MTGDRATMAVQLRHLRQMTALPNVCRRRGPPDAGPGAGGGRRRDTPSVRVLPLAAGLSAGAVAGSFTLLDFAPDGNRAVPELPVVYQESLTGALYLDRPAELAAFERAWARLAASTLDPDQSRRLIGKIAEQVHGG